MPRTPKTPAPACVATTPDAIPLRVCEWCDGTTLENDEDCGAIPCLSCSGGGYADVSGDLGATHSYPTRPFTLNPGNRRLTVTRDNKVETYVYFEFIGHPDADGPIRAFEFEKLSDHERYDVQVSRLDSEEGPWVRCECKGFVSEGTRRANERARGKGEGTYASLGCLHSDAVRLFLPAGLMEAK